MGSFANTVFSVLLGWVQAVISMLWSALSSGNGNPFLQFIGNNWIVIALILCAAGLAADFTVYLFRWKPYKVWRSALRRLLGRRGETGETAEEEAAPAEPEVPARRFAAQREAEPETDELERWRTPEEEIPEAPEEEEPDEVTPAGYVVPADSPYRRPAQAYTEEERQIPAERERPGRRRTRLIRLLGDPDNEEEFHYNPPKPIVDRREAYNAPVYPENWQGSRNQDT